MKKFQAALWALFAFCYTTVTFGANTVLQFDVHNGSSCAATNITWKAIYNGNDGSGSHCAPDAVGCTSSGPFNVGAGGTHTTLQAINGGATAISATVSLNNGFGGAGIAGAGQTVIKVIEIQGQGCCTNTSGGNGGLCVHHTFNAPIRNDSDYPMNAHWDLDGVTIHTETIPPHGTGNFTYSYDGDHSASWGGTSGGGIHVNPDGSISGSLGAGGGGGIFVGPGDYTNNTGGDIGGGTNISIVFTNAGNQTGFLTNGLINWNSTDTTAARDATLRAGFNAQIYHDGILELELGQINDALRANLGSNNTVVNVSLTNNNNVTVTNNNNLALTNNVQITNVVDMSGISNQLSNVATNRGSAGTNALVFDWNSAKGNAEGDSGVSSFKSEVGTWVTGLPGPADPGAGSAPTFDVLVGDFNMHFDPMGGAWAPVWQLSKQILAWMLVAILLVKIAKDSFEVIKPMAAAHGANIQPLEVAGFSVGEAVIGTIIGAFVVGWGLILAGIAIYMGTQRTGFAGIFNTSFLDGVGGDGVSQGIEMIKLAIPIGLLFTTTVVYIIWRATITGAVAVGVIATKFLTGA